jgi:uncharacterized protein
MDSAVATDDATWWVIGDPSRIKVAGLKDHRKTVRLLMGLRELLPHGMRHHIITTDAEDDRVAVEVEAEGNWHDGRPYRDTHHFLLRIKEGKIASVREYMGCNFCGDYHRPSNGDTGEILRQGSLTATILDGGDLRHIATPHGERSELRGNR